MSQRGGSVVTYVRYGEHVSSPIIETGEADVIISFELLEAARYLSCLKKGGTVVVNTQQIDPMPVITGAAEYPAEILEKMQAAGIHTVAIDALKLAEEAGSTKAVNVVLMGVVARHMEIEKEVWIQTIRDTVPAKFVEMNLKAFELGFNA